MLVENALNNIGFDYLKRIAHVCISECMWLCYRSIIFLVLKWY